MLGKPSGLIGFAAISVLVIAKSISIAACPPTGATGITTCCAHQLAITPCGVPINKNLMRVSVPPKVTITPDVGNPNAVTISITNGSWLCSANGACKTTSCAPGSYLTTPYYFPLTPTNITPGITRTYSSSAWIGGNVNHVDLTKLTAPNCTIKATWSAACGAGTHTDTYTLGPCSLAPQTKPAPKPMLNSSPIKCTPCEKGCSNGEPDPVDPYSGDYFYQVEDLSVPGVFPIKAVRSYRSSLGSFTGPFGKGTYLSTYNYSITPPTNPGGTVNTSPNQTLLIDEGNGLTTSYTNGSGGGLVFTNTDSLGAAGTAITLNLDGSNFLASGILKTVKDEELTFDSNGRLSQLEDRNGNTVTLTRDGSGKLTTITAPGGRSLTLAYNANNFIESISDQAGRTANYTYDSGDHLQTATDPDGLSYSFAWDSSDRILSVNDRENEPSFILSYQDNGMVKEQSMFAVSGSGLTYRLDATGALTRRITDPNGNTRDYTYDSNGLLTTETDGLGHSTNTTYSASLFNGSPTGRYIEKTDALSNTYRADLNADNLPTTLTDPDNNTITITYDSTWTHKPATITDQLNHTTTFTYDVDGNLSKIEDANSNDTDMTYNARGQVLTVTNALSKTTTYAYDTDGNLTSITDPLSRVTSFTYDPVGRLETITDPKSQTTTLEYNDNSWLTKITDANSGVTEIAYDNNGNATSIRNPRNNLTTYLYDWHNRLTRITEPGSVQTNFTYDPADRLTRITDPKSQQRNFTYDAANRLTQQETKTGSTVQSTYTYTYDNADRLLTIGDGTNTWSLTYDPESRVTQIVSPQGTVDYTYDVAGRRTDMAATAQTAVSYVYDVLNQLTSVTQGANTYGFNYDAIGRRTSLTRPNGVTTSYTYDDANQLTQIHHEKPTVLDEQYDFTFDNNGNILTVDRDSTYTRTYTYDALNRVTKMVKSPVPGEALPKQIDWTYDADSNITKRKETDDSNNITTYDYTYNNRDFMTQRTTNGSGAVTYTYDNNGNLTGDGTRSFTWNILDQLTQLTSGATTTNFAYDPLGKRTSFTQGATSKSYFYDGLNLISDGSSSFLNGLNIDEALSITNGGNTHSFLADQLGSTSQLSDNTGASAAVYSYDPYGSLLSSSTPLAANPLTFTGREDDGTGLYYYRARYYDPNLEVFISQDPLGDAQRYVAGNPLIYVDPLGLDYWLEGAVSGEGGFPFHESICSGKYGGERTCNSFGVTSSDESPINGAGRIYRDTSAPGPISPGSLVKTSIEIDKKIRRYLEMRLGTPGTYNVGVNNCRTYSEHEYKLINSRFGNSGIGNKNYGLPRIGN